MIELSLLDSSGGDQCEHRAAVLGPCFSELLIFAGGALPLLNAFSVTAEFEPARCWHFGAAAFHVILVVLPSGLSVVDLQVKLTRSLHRLQIGFCIPVSKVNAREH